jgi:hypothetical protein
VRPFRRRNIVVFLALVAMIGWLGYAVVRNNAGPAALAPSTGTPSPSPVTPQGAVKPVIEGLISENGPPPANYLTSVRTFVVSAKWADLQPTAGGPITPGNAIDRAVATARQEGLGVKVRFLAGINAPDWAKNIDGPPVLITDPVDHVTGTIGRFWTDDFGRAYDDVQTKLAALYDTVPEIREITISRCTTVYAEPFIRDAGDPVTVQALLAAGFTYDADVKCLREQIDINVTAWRSTRSGVAFSVYQHIDANGVVTKDEALGAQLEQYCRQSLGQRCVLENNSLRATSRMNAIYTTMKQLGPPISFQTAGPQRIGDVNATLSLAVSLGATSVELLTSLIPDVSNIGLVNQAMVANAAHALE